jgi:hypothetical protein
VLAPKPTDVTRGDEVLARIFGSKDVSRTVAQDASSALSGIAGWLDLDGNGNPLDDVMRAVGKVLH